MCQTLFPEKTVSDMLMLPPPCFTDEMVFFGSKSTPISCTHSANYYVKQSLNSAANTFPEGQRSPADSPAFFQFWNRGFFPAQQCCKTLITMHVHTLVLDASNSFLSSLVVVLGFTWAWNMSIPTVGIILCLLPEWCIICMVSGFWQIWTCGGPCYFSELLVKLFKFSHAYQGQLTPYYYNWPIKSFRKSGHQSVESSRLFRGSGDLVNANLRPTGILI